MTAKQVNKTNRKQRSLIVLAAGCLICVLAGIGMVITGTEVAGLVSAAGLGLVFGCKWLIRSIGNLWETWKRQKEQIVFPDEGQKLLLLPVGKSLPMKSVMSSQRTHVA